MPYLETAKDGETEEEMGKIEVPNIEGKSIKEAEKELKDLKLELCINNEQEGIDKENTTVKNQTPLQGISVKEGSKVYIDY